MRQKIGGINMSTFIVKQMPVLTPEQIEESGWQRAIVERVARLCWFNHDLDGWMEELREEAHADYELPTEPVIWDEAQRAVWQAELDAIFATSTASQPKTSATSSTPKTYAARAASTKPSVCSKTANSGSWANTAPSASSSKPGTISDLTTKVTIIKHGNN